MTNELYWFLTIPQLTNFVQLHNEKNQYIRDALFSFLKSHTRNRWHKTELMESTDLPENAEDGFRIYLNGGENFFFEFVRMKDESFRVRSTVDPPKLAFTGECSAENAHVLNFCYQKAIDRLIGQ